MPDDEPGAFLDTNVILYIASADAAKAARAEALIAAGGWISVQVLNEIASVARRKMALTWTDTHGLLDAVSGLLNVTPVSIDTHREGLALSERYRLSVYDAMIAASALECGCETLWSEDMQDGLVISNRLTVRNPFKR